MANDDNLDLSGFDILVVEDDIFIGPVLVDYLRELGAQVSWVTTLADGLVASGNGIFTIAIVDLNLDGSFSTPIIDKLLKQHTLVILCSGYDEESIELRHRDLPRAQKPFTRANIRRLLTIAVLEFRILTTSTRYSSMRGVGNVDGERPVRTAGYRIEIDPAREFMRITLWGDWTNAQTDELFVGHAKAVRFMKEAGARHGHFLTLVDIRNKRLSEAEVIAEFRKSMDVGSPSKRIAIIVTFGLPRSMAGAIDSSGRVFIAYSEQEALAWLFTKS